MNRRHHAGKKLRKRHHWQMSLVSVIVGLVLYGFYSVVDTLSSVRLPQSDQPAELYSNQARDDLRNTFSLAIDQAKQSVILVVYTLTDSKIIEALKKKAEAGIDVFVVYDLNASPAWVGKKLGKKVHAIKRDGRGLMHQKLLVIDETQAWIGSANMTTESLKMHGNLITAINSAPVAQMIAEKAKSLKPTTRTGTFPHRDFLLGSQKMELWFLPDNPDGVDRILDLVNKATTSIKIAMFTWTRRDFAQAVIAAHQRGVNVEVAMDINSGKGASAEVVALLCQAGIPLSFSRGNALLHYKMMIVDDHILVNGSANWTKAAFTQNDDCFIILQDLTEAQLKMLQGLWDVILFETDMQTELITKAG